MSAPPSPHTRLVRLRGEQEGKRDQACWPTENSDDKSTSDGDILRIESSGKAFVPHQEPQFGSKLYADETLGPLSSVPEMQPSTSSSSSPDPYYFMVPSRNESPRQDSFDNPLSMTSEDLISNERTITVDDPLFVNHSQPNLPHDAWSWEDSSQLTQAVGGLTEGRGEISVVDERMSSPETSKSDSPWTIEAVELEEHQDTLHVGNHSLANADESGGEEILYPRQSLNARPDPVMHVLLEVDQHVSAQELSRTSSPSHSDVTTASNGVLHDSAIKLTNIPRHDSPSISTDDSKSTIAGSASERKTEAIPSSKRLSILGEHHQNVQTTREKPHLGSRSGRLSQTSSGIARSNSIQSRAERHSRQSSLGLAAQTTDRQARRGRAGEEVLASPSRTTDQSVPRPPVMSSRLSQPPKEKDVHSPSVAHSLLRGTQEGWSLNDEATAEALRKLDGISSKSARRRSSYGSTSRAGSHSRPGTPSATKVGHQWEGIESGHRLSHRTSNVSIHKDKLASKDDHAPSHDREERSRVNRVELEERSPGVSGEEGPPPSSQEKAIRKSVLINPRSSFSAKRASASSTNYTGTPTNSSRDSASLSTTTSATSVSSANPSTRLVKNRRNSAGSDVSSTHSLDPAGVENLSDMDSVPPVPPLPKDLSSFKTPPVSSTALVFPMVDAPEVHSESVDNYLRSGTQTLGPVDSASSTRTPQTPSSSVTGSDRENGSLSAPVKSPRRKWSFSNALNFDRSKSPNKPASDPQSQTSPSTTRSSGFVRQVHKLMNKDTTPVRSHTTSTEVWPQNNIAMSSATSLSTTSSVGSVTYSASPASPFPTQVAGPSHVTHLTASARPGTGSSESPTYLYHTITGGEKASSPSFSANLDTSKRLAPSSIPFFRRSSSQSMQLVPNSSTSLSISPTWTSAPNSARLNLPATSPKSSSFTSPSAQKKNSMLSLGIPSILKGSASRRSLQVDKGDSSSKENVKSKLKDADKGKDSKKGDEKDRSESRISVLMGRKRGKTVSSADAKKVKPVALPPIQMSGIPPVTVQRLANLKPSSSSSSLSTSAEPLQRSLTTSSSRATSQTISSMQKQAEASLRTNRQQLPTIAGSPSAGLLSQHHKESREPSLQNASISSVNSIKETPTKIPRITSRSSGVPSPNLKQTMSARRTSVNLTGLTSNPLNNNGTADEFGILGDQSPTKLVSENPNSGQNVGMPPSPAQRSVRQQSSTISTLAPSVSSRRIGRESMTFTSVRKPSSGSVSSFQAGSVAEAQNRSMTFSPSKGLNKLLTPKISLTASRAASSAVNTVHRAIGTPSSRQSISTPSPVPSSVDEDEILGDEEMLQYIQRQQARKLASGSKKEELDEMLRFPEPQPPGQSLSPQDILFGNDARHLSVYERKEIRDYPSIYYFGQESGKKMVNGDVSTNNYGYDDERGDYLIVPHDHLAYRYEVIDTLGKGSFGQVLHCRDHCTGESVAVKIIRNKKRFHVQALVEIKILDSLKQWDPEEKHHVIKMTEHFYFRNHLCIAMELLSINLYELIKANNFTGFTTTLVRRFTTQMLHSLALMRHHRIVHCDLKPENVLLRHPMKSAIKVIDFGSSCFDNDKVYTYIQSRFYRSPEVILGMNYSMAIDMWSLGCILAELYTGFPLFPGENEQEQLSCIMEVLGVPEKDLINRASRKTLFFDRSGEPRPVVNSKGRRRRPGTKTLKQVLKCEDELFVDFVAKCLLWDPERRIKPQSALRHPFITAGRRSKNVRSSMSSRSLLSPSGISSSSRSKGLAETPKKSLISAPTPLSARVPRAPTTTQIPSTPINSSSYLPLTGSAKSHRTSQIAVSGLRPLNGYATASAK